MSLLRKFKRTDPETLPPPEQYRYWSSRYLASCLVSGTVAGMSTVFALSAIDFRDAIVARHPQTEENANRMVDFTLAGAAAASALSISLTLNRRRKMIQARENSLG